MLHRLIQSALMLLGSALAGSLIVFLLLRLLKGDAATAILGTQATPEAVARLRGELGLDRPWPVQYVDWLSGLVRGDLGTARGGYSGSYDIFDQIRERFGVTFSLVIVSLVLSSIIALVAGTYAAIHSTKRRGVAVDVLAQLGIAIPTFWAALMLVGFFSLQLGWLPTGGYVSWTESPTGALRSMALPVLAISIPLAGIQVRFVRSAMIEVLNEDYIRTAIAKGRTFRGALAVHGIRNASIPLVTVGVLQLGGLLTGAVLVEVVFSLPGLGRLLVEAVARRDIVVVQSLVFVLLLLIFTFNFLMDIAYGLLDPRMRDTRRAGRQRARVRAHG